MQNEVRATSKVKHVYDAIYSFVLVLCKLLLIADILITTMAVAGRYIEFIPDLYNGFSKLTKRTSVFRLE